MATAELAKSKAAELSGTRTARERNEPGEPAIDPSPDLGS